MYLHDLSDENQLFAEIPCMDLNVQAVHPQGRNDREQKSLCQSQECVSFPPASFFLKRKGIVINYYLIINLEKHCIHVCLYIFAITVFAIVSPIHFRWVSFY